MNRNAVAKQQYIKKIVLAFASFIGSILIGTAFYRFYEDYGWIDAIYMAVITFSTVGFGEIHELSDNGRLFTSIYIIFNLSVLAYSASTVARFLFEGDLRNWLKMARMEKSIKSLRNHVIVCGYGRLGRQVCRELMGHERQVVLVEQSEEALEEAFRQGVEYCVLADATNEDELEMANVTHAEAVITILPSDADNVYVVLTARELKGDIHTISRAESEKSVNKLKRAGADDVIRPAELGGTYIADLVTQPRLIEFVSAMSRQNKAGIYFETIELQSIKPSLQGKSILELDVRNKTGAYVLGFRKHDGSYEVNPSPTWRLNEGKEIIILGSADQVKSFVDLVVIK